MEFQSVKKSPNAGIGGGFNAGIIIFDWDDVAVAPRRIGGVVMEGSLIMKPGGYMIELEASNDSIKNSSKDEGEFDAIGVMQEVSASVPGHEEKFRKLKVELRGRKLGVLTRYCDGRSPDLFGSRCTPLMFQSEFTHDKDAKKTTITFKSVGKGPDVAIYKGSLILQTNHSIAADASTVDLAQGAGSYEFGNNTSSVNVTGFSNAEDGKIYTLLGKGTTNSSSIATSNTILLKEGVAWTGVDGASITFQFFDNGTDKIAIEVGRS